MSSEAAAVTEQASNNQGLVPKLRFPEFRDAGPWKQQELSALLTERTEKNRQLKFGPEHVLSVSGDYGCVNQIEFMGRSYAGASVKEYNIVRTGDIVYTKSPLKACPNGIIKANKGSEGIVSVLYAVYRLTAAATTEFIDYYFSSDHKLNTYLQPLVKKGPKNSILVKNSDVLKGLIAAPNVAEQQRVVECLSSLDAVIASEKDRLTALREHKKGLVQQLFPAKGETTPRLRFQEFRDAGEWEEREVGDVFTVTRGNVLAMPLVDDAPSARKPFPVYSSQTKRNGLAGYYSDYLYEDAITWTTDGANAGEVKYRAGKFFCTNVCGVLINRDGYANPCVAEIINNVSRDHVSYVGNPKLMNGVMAKIRVAMPTVGEQQRISEWLGLINDLIAASESKVDVLKAHKSGLMQQLFPSLVEAIA